jgi:hydrogenase expression/formation protein
MDVEEFVRRQLRGGVTPVEACRKLSERVREFKPVDPGYAARFSGAVVDEVQRTLGLSGDLFAFTPAGVGMGEFGVGSRGTGDFFAHRQIARIIGRTCAEVGVDQMDDAGAVAIPGGEDGDRPCFLLCAVDGMHSRLSDYPFLAGFHATRATLRDIYVMGARPVMLFSDIHVADDGDVAKCFDYTAGITTVGELMGVPLVSGSTLRIGGDMVLGSRMTGCVGAVGIGGHLTARREAKAGDSILMSSGAGGGTITTAAIYSGYPEVVEETINLDFLHASEALLASGLLPAIHAMTDVTNGGLRGDAHELAATAGCRIVIEEEVVSGLVSKKVCGMLDTLGIDPLGVSLDALLVIAPPDTIRETGKVLAGVGVESRIVGCVEEGPAASVLISGGKETDFVPRFRESAYTPVKKVVDRVVRDASVMERAVADAADAAIRKKERIIARLRAVR